MIEDEEEETPLGKAEMDFLSCALALGPWTNFSPGKFGKDGNILRLAGDSKQI